MDVNYDDCTLLAEAYRKAWLRHARENEKPVDEKLREQVEKNLTTAAESAGANWLRACASVVGTKMPRANLVCASKAKTLERFDACWDGKVE